MTGLEKYEAWLDKGNEILNLRKEGDNRVWVSKDEALAKARRLLAEEKAGDEGLRDNAQYIGLSELNYILDLARSEHEKAWAAGVERMAWEKAIRLHRPAPDRTEELVKRLRELADVGCGEGLGFLCVRNRIYEILADFEKGAK